MIGRLRNYLAHSRNSAQLGRALLGSTGLRIIGMGFGFLVGVQLARGLGPAGYGIYGTAMAIMALLMIPTELGLPQLVMREVSAARAISREGSTNAIVIWARRTVVRTSLVIATFTFVVIVSDLVAIDQAVQSVLLVGLLWIPVVALGNIYGAALRGEHRVVGGQLNEVLLRPAVISLTLAGLACSGFASLTPSLAMGVNVLGALVGAGFSIVYLRTVNIDGRNQAALIPTSLKFGEALPIAMAEGTRVVAAQVGVLVLAALASQTEVGLYRVASSVYIATTMPSTLINVVCAPTISRFFSLGNLKSVAHLNLFISVFLAATAAIFLAFHIFLGRAAILVVFGSGYAEAGNLLFILLVGELVASLFGHPVVVLNMMRRQRAVMWCSVAALAINFAIAIVLVGTIGYTGAAIGAAVGAVLWRVSCAVYAKRKLGLDTSWMTRAIPTEISF